MDQELVKAQSIMDPPLRQVAGSKVGQAEEEEGEDKKELDSNKSDDEEVKVPPKELTEVDRLSYVVFAIENDC